MGRGSPTMPWPPRSPDITPCDFFLWGFMKSIVYSTPSATIDELKVKITDAFQLITAYMMQNVFQNYRGRLEQLLSENGKHIELYDNN